MPVVTTESMPRRAKLSQVEPRSKEETVASCDAILAAWRSRVGGSDLILRHNKTFQKDIRSTWVYHGFTMVYLMIQLTLRRRMMQA